MKLITSTIRTGKAKSFEDFIADFKSKQQVKTASVKTAEQDEADSSGQLDVEPLHQEGESTTMPKNGPSAKKDDGEKSAAATKEPDAEGKSSGQPEAEGSEKFTNDPEVPSKEEKGGSIEVEEKTAGELPEALKEYQFKAKDNKDDKDDKKPGVPDGTGPGKDSPECPLNDDDDDDKEEKVDKKAGKIPGVPDGTGPRGGSQACPFNKDEDKKDEDKKEAKTSEFVKIANLDDKNKSFLKNYWRQIFGEDYANALISDK